MFHKLKSKSLILNCTSHGYDLCCAWHIRDIRTQALKQHFRISIGCTLLYPQEQTQYKEAAAKDTFDACRAYGPEHLLRDFTKLPVSTHVHSHALSTRHALCGRANCCYVDEETEFFNHVGSFSHHVSLFRLIWCTHADACRRRWLLRRQSWTRGAWTPT